MMQGKVLCILLIVVHVTLAFYESNRLSKLFVNKWFRSKEVVSTRLKLSMASLEPSRNKSGKTSSPSVAEPRRTNKAYKPDFSSFLIGQEYDAKVISSHSFGVFVDINKGVNVLLPKSKLGKQFEVLKTMVENKSNETIKISLTDISPETGKVAGTILKSNSSGNSKNSLQGDDAAWLQLKEQHAQIIGQSFNTTVMAAHNFGLFVKVNEFQVEGLVPLSKLPVKTNLREVYPIGSSLMVTVEDLQIDNKRLVLSAVPKPDIRSLLNFPEDKWTQSVVQNVNSFGLFVRPAGYDVVGLVRRNQIPTELIKVLRTKLQIDRRNVTVLEEIFSIGDVLRVRLEKLDVENGKVEFSMLPKPKEVVSDLLEDKDFDLEGFKEYFAGEFDEASLSEGSEEVETDSETTTAAIDLEAAASGEEFEGRRNRRRNRERMEEDDDEEDDEDAIAYADEEETEPYYDPLTTLVWWKGKPFTGLEEEDTATGRSKRDRSSGRGVEPVGEEEEEEDAYDDDMFMEGLDDAVSAQFVDAPWMTESPLMTQGAWRRLVSLDFNVVDEAQQKEKNRLEDLKEIEMEIGSMKGFDEEIAQALPPLYMSNIDSNKLGAFVNFDHFPEWKAQSAWYAKYEQPLAREKPARIRYGKKNMDLEWEKELDELERSLQSTQSSAAAVAASTELAAAISEEESVEEPKESNTTEAVIESIIAGDDYPEGDAK